MFNIVNYTANAWLILAEGSKYFVLLVLCILSIRLWRRWSRISSARNAGGLVMACVATLLAAAIGYVSMHQSLAAMDSYYGMKAFDEGRLPQAVSLFETSERLWQNGDTMGRRGVCLLFLGQADQGLALLDQARAMRKGEGTSFEFIYQGLYHFTQGDTNAAMKYLRTAAKDPTYRWTATKIIAVLKLDENQVAAALEDMKPFMQFDVTDFDQAYVLAALRLADGKKDEARALLDKFPAASLTPQWQSRYEKLRARLQD
jgi:tetratricopeptide (TPR) repeat protein